MYIYIYIYIDMPGKNNYRQKKVKKSSNIIHVVKIT